MPELVFLRQGEELLRVALERSRVVLGRAESSDIVIPDAEVGRHQVAVLYDGHALMVEDLSGKGTVVSGGKTDRAQVRDGADIALGQWHAVLREPSSLDESQPRCPWDPLRWSSRGPSAGMVRVFGAESSKPLSQTSLAAAESALPHKQLPLEAILGADPVIRQLADFIERAALSRSLVAVFGEQGSGRELVARTLHTRSGRAAGPFVRVNCRAVRNEFLEAELFGLEERFSNGGEPPRRGAFEEAAGGTVFLDEVGELSLELQAKLLEALESREFRRVGANNSLPLDVRLVVATDQDLLSATRFGRFRADLYDLLCLTPVVLPPLRHRLGDVPALAEHLVKTFSPRGQPVSLTSGALGRLTQHAWPGNMRELRNVVLRALLLRTGPTIDVRELRFDPDPSPRDASSSSGFTPGLTLEQMLRQREREIVESALRHFDNNRERVARELGVARSTLFKRLKDWGLTKHTSGPPSA
jgi:two-component system, NtrC family, response regulator HydG